MGSGVGVRLEKMVGVETEELITIHPPIKTKLTSQNTRTINKGLLHGYIVYYYIYINLIAWQLYTTIFALKTTPQNQINIYTHKILNCF